MSCRSDGITTPITLSITTMASSRSNADRPMASSAIRDVVKLPAALATSSEKSTTDRL